MSEEEWRVIPDWPDYAVSSLGQVKRVVACEAKGRRLEYPVGRIAQCSTKHNGYLIVNLLRNGLKKKAYVHRLVAHAFLGECPVGYQVNHRDGVKTHNVRSNLEYVTRLQQMAHAVKHELVWSKLSWAMVDLLRTLWQTGRYTQGELGQRFGVDHSQVSNIVRGKCWKVA